MPHGGEAGGLLRAFDGPTLMLCSPVGDVEGWMAGLYHLDTRYLSRWELRVGGRPLVLLTSHPLDHRTQLFYLTNARDSELPFQGLTVRRHRVVGEGMREEVRVTSHLDRPAGFDVTMTAAADFSSVMEVRRGYVEPVGRWRTQTGGEDRVARFSFDHERFAAAAEVTTSVPAHLAQAPPAPAGASGAAPADRVTFSYRVDLAPHDTWQVDLNVRIEPECPSPEPARIRLSGVPDHQAGAPRTDIVGDWPGVSAVCRRSLADLEALRFEAVVGESHVTLPVAGVPWFLAVIGRDMLWTGYQALPFAPHLAEGALRALAGLQSTRDDPETDAEPGKILHEVRFGKLTALGERPYRPYYGTVDATPLFLILLSEHWRVTGDPGLCLDLRAAATAALGWLDDHADLDGDGLVEYRRRAPQGGRNHCWKDSEDSIRFADGTVADGPIATCEVQGYAFDARLRMAEVAEALWGDAPLAQRLRSDAQSLAARFDKQFWIDRRGGYYALALDGDKRPVDALTSNLGHLLWSGIVPAARAGAVTAQLSSPALRSGWGLRTMSTDDGAFNPISYHNGSVWPHDTAIAVSGLTRYGFRQEACDLAVELLEAAARMEEHRLPELFSGHSRKEAPFPVWYAEAASPQGWAAAAPLLLLRSVLGLRFEAGRAALDPALPNLLRGLQVTGPAWSAAGRRGPGSRPSATSAG